MVWDFVTAEKLERVAVFTCMKALINNISYTGSYWWRGMFGSPDFLYWRTRVGDLHGQGQDETSLQEFA